MKKIFYILILLFVGVTLYTCKKNTNGSSPMAEDFDQIQKKKKLTAITLSSSISYFIYKGEPMGYEYEILKNFADAYNLELDIKIAENTNRLAEMLEAGEGDLVAYDIPVTNQLKQELIYCGNESINEQVLIQRTNKKDTILKDVTELIGKEIWVVKESKYYHRLVNLNQELGGGIIIKEIERDTVSVEDLIGMVSSGDIKYTVSDMDIAQLNKTYFSNINISLKVSHPQRSSWAVKKTSPALADTLNKWFAENVNTPRYKAIMKRYFEMSKMPGEEPSPILSGNKISPYDLLFKKYAKKIGWDWKLLASISYQESRFDTASVSWAGATGLMGLMPRTAKAFGLDPDKRTNPEGNIHASVKYISSLQKNFSGIESDEEKLKLILASYNAGLGHIYDAQALARKLNKNPHIWEGNVEECLKLKRIPEYYNDSVCKFGYFRGTETLNYVQHVIERWKHYKEKVKN